ncbi:centromere protein V-like [Ciona intestinalis]
MSADLVKHTGGCHCGAVRFEVMETSIIYAIDCNCSICYMKSNAHFIVPSSNFKLLKGSENLTTYTFNTHQAKHTFCKICGVQSFYTPRSNTDGYGINPRCIDKGTIEKIISENFDGDKWEASMEKEKLKDAPITDRSKSKQL